MCYSHSCLGCLSSISRHCFLSSCIPFIISIIHRVCIFAYLFHVPLSGRHIIHTRKPIHRYNKIMEKIITCIIHQPSFLVALVNHVGNFTYFRFCITAFGIIMVSPDVSPSPSLRLTATCVFVSPRYIPIVVQWLGSNSVMLPMFCHPR